MTKKKTTKKPRKKVSTKKKTEKSSVVPVDPDFDESKALIEAVGGETDVAIFFSHWLGCDRDHTQAYLKMHPNVTKESARVLGSRLLQKVPKTAILESYNLGISEYIGQLREGLSASKTVTIGSGENADYIDVPDHKTRRHYHRALGEILKLEGQSQPIVVNQNNLQQNNNIESLPDEDLDLILNR